MAEAPGAVNDAAARDAADGGHVVAYLVNQYPKVSHTFIRREILALEKQGLSVERYALRGWDAEITDAEDRSEQSRTRYVLVGGLPALAGAGGARIHRTQATAAAGELPVQLVA